jgi:hypothetical protein
VSGDVVGVTRSWAQERNPSGVGDVVSAWEPYIRPLDGGYRAPTVVFKSSVHGEPKGLGN